MFSRVIAAAVFGLAAAAAHAGPPLDAAIGRLTPWSDEPAPGESLETAPTGPGNDAPWLVPGGAPSHYVAHMVSRTQSSGRLRLRAGFAWNESAERAWSLEGSVIALELDGPQELYASVERRHWGPGWIGSLILDGSAPALPAVGWRRAPAASSQPWLRWMGPWSADVFFAQLMGHSEPRRPWLIGMRVELAPVESLRIGLVRTMQWGGVGRDESGSSLLAGLLGRDNSGSSGIDAANEPGNQLAGFDWRWTPAGPSGVSLYGQMVGEDEARMFPSKRLLLLGADVGLPGTQGQARWFVEAADTIAGDIGGHPLPAIAYRHHIYQQGYTHDGQMLGHPAGGDVRLLSTGTIVRHGRSGTLVALSAGNALSTAQRFVAGRLYGFNAAAHFDVSHEQRLGAGLWWWHDGAGTRSAAQLWWQYRH